MRDFVLGTFVMLCLNCVSETIYSGQRLKDQERDVEKFVTWALRAGCI